MNVKTYNYEWKTEDEVIANINTKVRWEEYGKTCTLAEITEVTNPETYRKAHKLWLKLKDAFNKEAETYDPEAYNSKLGSVGNVERREGLTAEWWYELSDYEDEERDDIVCIIEVLHCGEKLETGIILFGC